VLFYHYGSLFPHPGWLRSLTGFGWSGVDLFFVLSGYLMGTQLLRQVSETRHVRICEFYVKRFFRIIPAYGVVVAAYFLFPTIREFPTIRPLWRFLTFTQNLGFNVAAEHAFSHAWSLCVEEHFYLFLPMILVALASPESRRGILAGWVAISILIFGMAIRAFAWNEWVSRSYSPSWWEWIYFPTYARLDSLMVGVVAAAVRIFKPSYWSWLTQRWPLLLGCSVGLLCIACFFLGEQQSLAFSVMGFPLVAIGYGCLLLACVSPGCFLHRTHLTVTSRVAAWSYSLYLTHKIVIHVCQSALEAVGLNVSSNLTLCISITASLIVAATLYRVVERPFLALRELLLSSKSSIGAGGSARVEQTQAGEAS
jgi:peptidoglycan/LPS O-acetylase OafA/YrhL